MKPIVPFFHVQPLQLLLRRSTSHNPQFRPLVWDEMLQICGTPIYIETVHRMNEPSKV